jgi:putative DNA primase/helicase
MSTATTEVAKTRQKQEDEVIAYINALLLGEIPDKLPELHQNECEAILINAKAKGSTKELIAETIKNIRRMPAYKAFDELLSRTLDTKNDNGEYIPPKKEMHIEPPDIPLEELLKYARENHYGDALLFARAFAGQVCYDTSRKMWYLWHGHYWKEDTSGYIKTIISAHLSSVYLRGITELNNKQLAEYRRQEEQDKNEDEQQEVLSENIARIKAKVALITKKAGDLRKARYNKDVLYFAMSVKNVAVDGGIWDKNPFLLGVANGVVDMRTGLCHDGKPEEYIRSVAPTEWRGLKASCPRFEQFLEEIFELLPEEQMQASYADWTSMSDEQKATAMKEQRDILLQFIRRLLGYATSGLSKEAVFSVFYGEEGRNGKDTIFRQLQEVLGNDIASAVSSDVILDTGKHTGGAATPHLCDLQHKRIVWCSETKRGDTIDIAQLKLVTGGGTIPVRALFQHQSSFNPSHTLFLMTNNKPHASPKDDSFWTRAALIEFCMRFVDKPEAFNERKRDINLESKLEEEHSGILAYLVRGFMEYQKIGLQRPDMVLNATKKYRRFEDDIQFFIDECCIIGKEYQIKGMALYKAYKEWALGSFAKPMNVQFFSAEVAKKYKKAHTNNGNVFYGIGLNSGAI